MKLLLVLFSLIPVLAFSDRNLTPISNVDQPLYDLWFTGTLLELTPVNLVPGQVAIEPVLSVSNTYGSYNSDWKLKKTKNILSINSIMEFKLGLFPRTELKIVASYISKIQGNKNSSNFQDTLFYFGYQMLKNQKQSFIPDLSLFLQAIIPTGKFDKLNPKKKEVDASGQGAYQFGPALAYQKIFETESNYFILYGNFIYLFSTEVNIKEFNVYGGGFGTKGRIRPGGKLYLIFSGEYLFNQHWGVACDCQFLYQGKTSKFKGELGHLEEGIPATEGLPSSSQISLTSSIEYNFSAHCGIFGGAWFTAAGRNSTAFNGGFISLVYGF